MEESQLIGHDTESVKEEIKEQLKELIILFGPKENPRQRTNTVFAPKTKKGPSFFGFLRKSKSEEGKKKTDKGGEPTRDLRSKSLTDSKENTSSFSNDQLYKLVLFNEYAGLFLLNILQQTFNQSQKNFCPTLIESFQNHSVKQLLEKLGEIAPQVIKEIELAETAQNFLEHAQEHNEKYHDTNKKKEKAFRQHPYFGDCRYDLARNKLAYDTCSFLNKLIEITLDQLPHSFSQSATTNIRMFLTDLCNFISRQSINEKKFSPDDFQTLKEKIKQEAQGLAKGYHHELSNFDQFFKAHHKTINHSNDNSENDQNSEDDVAKLAMMT